MSRLRAAIPLATALSLSAFAAPALAQSQCNEHGTVLGQFKTSYEEVPIAAGLTQDGRLLEVLSSGDTGTWTILLSKPDGVTCVIMAGEAWRKLRFEPGKAEPNT